LSCVVVFVDVNIVHGFFGTEKKGGIGAFPEGKVVVRKEINFLFP
jgi:hypothetical protein